MSRFRAHAQLQDKALGSRGRALDCGPGVLVPQPQAGLRMSLASIPHLWNEGCAGFLLVKLKPSDVRVGAGEKQSSQPLASASKKDGFKNDSVWESLGGHLRWVCPGKPW